MREVIFLTFFTQVNNDGDAKKVRVVFLKNLKNIL